MKLRKSWIQLKLWREEGEREHTGLHFQVKIKRDLKQSKRHSQLKRREHWNLLICRIWRSIEIIIRHIILIQKVWLWLFISIIFNFIPIELSNSWHWWKCTDGWKMLTGNWWKMWKTWPIRHHRTIWSRLVLWWRWVILQLKSNLFTDS